MHTVARPQPLIGCHYYQLNNLKPFYASYDKGKGALFAKGKMSFQDLAALAKDYGTVGIQSGKQERLENLVNQYLMGL